MEKFKLWDVLINLFCQNLENLTIETKKLINDLKETFPEVFQGGLGRYNKMTVKFELKDNIQPGFKKKRNVPFVSLLQINEELDRLERTGVLLKIEYSQWASPTVYVKNKSKETRVCADFSTGLNPALKDYHYPLPSPEEIFAKLSGGIFFSKN